RVGHPQGGWPGTLLDCARATDFVSQLKDNFPIDINNMIAVGHSAGGHLALWLGLRNKLPKNSELYITNSPQRLSGIVALAPVTHLPLMYSVYYWEEKLFQSDDNPTKAFLGGRPEEYPERYEQASPYHLLPSDVPTILLHGKLDT